MASSKTTLNYDELNLISKQLQHESNDIVHLHSVTRQKLQALRGEWNGRAAEAFLNEMETRLLPAVQRVSAGLSISQDVLNQIMNTIHEADLETAGYFKGFADAVGGGLEKRTRIYLINGINYDGSEASFNNLKQMLEQKYGPGIDVVVVGAHPYGSNLMQYQNIFQPIHFGGWLSPVDWLAGKAINGLLYGANTAVGVSQVVREYISGGSVESQKVFEWIQSDLKDNPLVGNVVLVGHSGGGAIAGNIVDDIENKLHVNVSGVVTMGSPISNYDNAGQYAKIIDISNPGDMVGTPLGLGTIRSDEMRVGWLFPLTQPGGPVNFITSVIGGDKAFRDPSLDVQAVVTHDGLYSPFNPFSWATAHGSYWNSPEVVNAIGSVL